jgi:hypothetical protein
MSVMIEVIYRKPEDSDHERGILEFASLYRGVVSCREDDWGQTQQAICLTIEFWNWEDAETACAAFRERGDYVEGPHEYGSGRPGEN